jgi:capsular exopolysaccharide synthesis family protein
MGTVAKALRKAKTGAEAGPPPQAEKGGLRPEPAPPAPAARKAAPAPPAPRKAAPAPPAPAPAPPAPAGRKAAPAPPAPAPAPAEAPRRSVRPEAGRIQPDLVSLLEPEGPEAELFRVLRTRILFPPGGKRPPRTILVTSALAEEGKSFMAANLAVNIAQNVDEHVLLVDCDLRKPTICAKFGFGRVKGLSEYLSNGTELAPLLLKAGVEKLTLLPSGTPPSNPSELISSAKMAALIQELRARYEDRYIILDSPPPMMAPETSAIAQWADGILVVVKYGTSMELIEELLTHLDRDKLIGAVINKFDQREFRRYAYRKYYHYGKYDRA